ncbi:MAG TPA: GNAT family N-acetyltransferase [Steroidobacteraceae bacterium]|nr:GNAT family N-acetyltransferase [Steroidobacteraceae bacterium]
MQVDHDSAAHRFTALVDGERAVLDYTIAAGVMTITHTGVPHAIEGRGVAAELTRKALETARDHGWRVVPACSYAAAYLAKHPEEGSESARQHQSDLLDEALEETFPASDPPAVSGSS